MYGFRIYHNYHFQQFRTCNWHLAFGGRSVSGLVQSWFREWFSDLLVVAMVARGVCGQPWDNVTASDPKAIAGTRVRVVRLPCCGRRRFRFSPDRAMGRLTLLWSSCSSMSSFSCCTSRCEGLGLRIETRARHMHTTMTAEIVHRRALSAEAIESFISLFCSCLAASIIYTHWRRESLRERSGGRWGGEAMPPAPPAGGPPPGF